MLVVNPKHRATIEDICRHWWLNYGFNRLPQQQVQPGRPINFANLEHRLSFRRSSSDSDSESSPTKIPKSILKKPRDFTPKYCKDVIEKAEKQAARCEPEEPSAVTDSDTSPSSPCRDLPDISVKPKRGILKNKHKYTGADSGCVLEDINITEYFSSKDTMDTPGVSASSPPDCHSTDGVDKTDGNYDVSDIEAILDSLDLSDNGDEDEKSQSGSSERDGSLTPDSLDYSPPASHSRDSGHYEDLPGPATSTPTGGPPKLKGILKYSGKYSQPQSESSPSQEDSPDPSWRYSQDSHSSSSSGDILDISYDSVEGSDIVHRVVEPWQPPAAEAGKSDEGIFNDEDDGWFSSELAWQDKEAQEELLDDDYFDSGMQLHRNMLVADVFNMVEAAQVCQQARNICSKLS